MREREKEGKRKRKGEKERAGGREREKEGEREIGRETERERERNTHTHTHTHTNEHPHPPHPQLHNMSVETAGLIQSNSSHSPVVNQNEWQRAELIPNPLRATRVIRVIVCAAPNEIIGWGLCFSASRQK